MKYSIYYCNKWFRAKKYPIEIWTEEQAREAHINKKFYTALVDSEDFPYCFLEITEKAVGVSFLDDYLREFLMYDFQEFEPGKMFMTMAVYNEFVEDTDTVKVNTSYKYKQDGEVRIDKLIFDSNGGVRETSYTKADVSYNYEDYPKFGEYDGLIQYERNPDLLNLENQ